MKMDDWHHDYKSAAEIAQKAELALQVNEERMRAQKEAFQSVLNGAALADSLNILARLITRETSGDARTAFYVANSEGSFLRPIRGAGNMPDTYLDLVDKFPIGEDSLACGLAIPTGRPVLTKDVFEEKIWNPWLYIATAHDYRGCWSFPILTTENKAVGTLAMYFKTPREATSKDLALADIVTQTAAVIISNDTITKERACALEALRKSEAELRQLVTLKDEFISIASHELKTPVTSIKTYTELLLEGFEESGDRASAALMSKLDKQVGRLTKLIKDLLDTSKISQGFLELFPEQFDLNGLIAERIEELAPISTIHNILFRSFQAALVTADRERISQVIINLVSNAIKYSPRGGDIVITTLVAGDKVRVSVKDSGIGISPSVHDKVFERFFRVNNEQARYFTGMGLGLYISSEIIRRHGGALELSSDEGQGAVFSFTIPLITLKK